jgi:hypothetical protein
LLKAIILGLFPVVSPLYFLVTGHGFTSCGLREQPHTENPIPIVYSKISCSFKLKLVKLSIIIARTYLGWAVQGPWSQPMF